MCFMKYNDINFAGGEIDLRLPESRKCGTKFKIKSSLLLQSLTKFIQPGITQAANHSLTKTSKPRPPDFAFRAGNKSFFYF